MKGLLRKANLLWKVLEVPVLLVGIPAVFLVWAYSNFASATALSEAKSDLRYYVDQRHGDVKEDLDEIKAEQKAQRALSERILLKLSR